MIRIGICDDEDIFRENLRNIIRKYTDENRITVELSEYDDGINFIESGDKVDVLFLNVEMKTMSGIEVKNTLAMNREDTIIVFTTAYSKYTKDMIGRNVYYCLEKPVKTDEVYHILDNLFSALHENTKIEVEEAGKIYLLDYRKIKYIIAEDKYTRIYTENKKYLLRKKMKYWKEILPKELFCEINRSTIVSFAHFERKAGGVKLDNGNIAKFSRKHKNEIMENYKQYLRTL